MARIPVVLSPVANTLPGYNKNCNEYTLSLYFPGTYHFQKIQICANIQKPAQHAHEIFALITNTFSKIALFDVIFLSLIYSSLKHHHLAHPHTILVNVANN